MTNARSGILNFTAGLLIVAAMLFAGTGQSQAGCAKIKPTRPGEVYLMRGLANIFSLGLDEFGKEISKLGVENCVFNHSVWQSLVNDIVERSYRGEVSYPIIIIGHSLGANIAPAMTTSIGRHNIPVAYVAKLDPVQWTVVGKNVDEIHNYYLPKRQDTTVHAEPGFTGVLENLNLKEYGGFDHFNNDENRSLRNVMEQRVIELVNAQIEATKK